MSDTLKHWEGKVNAGIANCRDHLSEINKHVNKDQSCRTLTQAKRECKELIQSATELLTALQNYDWYKYGD